MAAPVIFNGISFPFRRGGTSFPAEATDDQLIKESLVQLILTQNGERIMRPDMGSNALSFIFEPNNLVLAQTLRAEIQAVVAKFEPRVVLTDVGVERDLDAAQVIVTIEYVVIASRTSSSVTVPLSTP